MNDVVCKFMKSCRDDLSEVQFCIYVWKYGNILCPNNKASVWYLFTLEESHWKLVNIYEDIGTGAMAQWLIPQSLPYSKNSWCTIYDTVKTIHIQLLSFPWRVEKIN